MNFKETTTGSSETIRETTFNFSRYKEKQVLHKKNIDRSFLEWFIGFSEGDGSFIVGKSRLFFIINQKEERILRLVRSNLGFGKVSWYNNFCRYVVADKTNVDRLISIFNGNLVLNKTNKRFASWLNVRNLQFHDKISLLPPHPIAQLETNAWLSGFIDGEGCFNVLKQKDYRYSLGWRVRLRFTIDQKDERWLLEKIKGFLESGIISERKSTEKMHRFTSFSLSAHHTLVRYLSRYSLRSKKKIDFVKWIKLLGYIERRQFQPWEGKILRRVERLICRNSDINGS